MAIPLATEQGAIDGVRSAERISESPAMPETGVGAGEGVGAACDRVMRLVSRPDIPLLQSATTCLGGAITVQGVTIRACPA